jgi:hypothetical protein
LFLRLSSFLIRARAPLCAVRGHRRYAPALGVALACLALVFLLGQQGARIGEWYLPERVPVWMWPLIALSLLSLPQARAPLAPSKVLVWALALAVIGVPLFAWRARVARPPVALSARLARPGPTEAQPARMFIPDLARLRRRPPWRRLVGRNQDFVLEIRAWVRTPRTASYRFALDADDRATLAVDGRVIVQEADRATATVPLAAGVHELTLRHEQGVGAAHLALDWARPGWIDLLPLDAYLADRPEALEGAHLRRRHAATLASLALAWGWWAVAGFVLVRLSQSRQAWPAWRDGEEGTRRASRRLWNDRELLRTAAIFTAAAAFLFAVEQSLRARAPDGVYFQAYSSEFLMQTVSLADLRNEPWRSLFYLHIQPPMLDALRAGLAARHPGEPDQILLRMVDADLLVVWGVAYATLVALVYRWLVELTSRRFALASAMVLAVHPAMMFYATLLDSTFLSALLFSWFSFELWRFSDGRGSPGRLVGVAILLFLTRSAFQWPFLIVLAACLALLRVPWRTVVRVLGIVGLAMALYLGKQQLLFGVTMTSTFAADSFCKGLGLYCPGLAPARVPELPPANRAGVLSRVAKLDGGYNYNQVAFLRRSFSQMEEYRAHMRQQTVPRLLRIYAHNLGFYLRPSSRYTAHVIVDRLPWRGAFDRVFSGWSLGALVLAAIVASLVSGGRAGWRSQVALALPVVYLFLVTVVFEAGENMRYKFFIEPVVFVFVTTQLHRLWRHVGRRRERPARRRDE